VLEFAPGLYERNYRVIKPLSVVAGNDKEVKTVDWWPNMLSRLGLDDDLFDPQWLHVDRGKATSKMSEANAKKYITAWEQGMEKVSNELVKTQHDVDINRSKFLTPPDINVQGAVSRKQKVDERKRIAEAIKSLKSMAQLWDHNQNDRPAVARPPAPDLSTIDFSNPVLKDMILELERKYMHKEVLRHDVRDHVTVFDSDMKRIEYRNVARKIGNRTYMNCLEVRTWKPSIAIDKGKYDKETDVYTWPKMEDYKTVVYYCNREGKRGIPESGGSAYITNDKVDRRTDISQWEGDGYVTRYTEGSAFWRDKEDMPDRAGSIHYEKGRTAGTKQVRTMRQSRLFITYSLHRAVTSEMEARLVMERMANAAHFIFGDDRILSQLLVFGHKLAGFSRDGKDLPLRKDGAGYRDLLAQLKPDTISAARYIKITKPRKKEALDTFYAEVGGSSYGYDTYETHVESVDVEGGIEIGPMMRHPHFHILLTINHWTYIQIDYFKMNHYLELLFRGQDPYNWFGDEGLTVKRDYMLLDASGGLFYTDNENPYVDIRLYPQDNWQDIISAYVRKGATDMVSAISQRSGPIRKSQQSSDT
jgi:hypothetical protein